MTPLDIDVDVPPSARHVAHVLQEEGPSTMRELAEYTASPPATVKNALVRLEDVGVITSRQRLDDGRRYQYGLRDR